jgi:hypothetical protein
VGRKSFIFLLIVTTLALSAIECFYGQAGFFVGNIVPELIGVCIELLIIIFILDVWQKKEEKNKKIKVERRLREFLIFFLKNNFKELPESCQPGSFYGVDHDQNQEVLSNLISNINQNGLAENVVLQVQSYCDTEKDIFHNLIPVASDLTNDHFKSWVRIAYFMNAVSYKKDTTSHAVVKILENIKRFDDQSFKSGLYVGAK